jgi:cytochrome c-type biogenesis protein CcmH
MVRLVLACLLCLLASYAGATSLPDERMTDQALEKKAESIYRDIRCVVCQSESIADSGADVAKDMRAVVREKVKSGESEQAILNYLQSRYGDSVLMKPPVQPSTWLLWAGPFLVFACGSIAAMFLFRRRKT